jgi:hypothetical protein
MRAEVWSHDDPQPAPSHASHRDLCSDLAPAECIYNHRDQALSKETTCGSLERLSQKLLTVPIIKGTDYCVGRHRVHHNPTG